MAADIGARIKLDGEKEFRQALKDSKQELSLLGSQLKLLDAEYAGNEDSSKKLRKEKKLLKEEAKAEKEQVKLLEERLKAAAAAYGETDSRTVALKKQLVDAKTKLAETNNELKNSGKSAEAAGKGWETFGKIAKTSAAALGAAVAAAGAEIAVLTKSLINGVSATAEYGDNIDKMSQKLGISAEAYQEWDFIAQHSGTSVDGLQTSMKKLAEAAVDGSDASVAAFNALGLTIDEARSMSQEDLFSAVITGLQGMEESTERTALAADLLGKSATELGPLLNTSAEATEAMRQQAHDLGAVMSNESVSASAAFQDSLQNLTTAFEGLKRGALSEFLPIFTGIMDGLTEIFSGNPESGIGMIVNGVKDFAGKIMEMLPKVIESGTQILLALSEAIISSIPILIPAAVDTVLTITQALIDNLPMILDAGVQAIIAIATGIGDALPELIPAALDAVLTIVEGLVDNIGEIVEAGITLLMGLTNGLIAALPQLIEEAPVIIQSLVDALIENLPLLIDAAIELIVTLGAAIVENLPALLDAALQIVSTIAEGIVDAFYLLVEKGKELVDKVKEGFQEKVDAAKTWGKDLISNFASGITEKWDHLKEKVSGVATGIKNILGFSEPKEGPLSNFHTYAPDMMDLFAKGIQDKTPALKRQIAESFDLKGDIENSLRMPQVSAAPPMGGMGAVSLDAESLAALRLAGANREQNIVVQLKVSGSLAQIARVLLPELETASRYAGVSLVEG